jgi:hypothetical protein
MPQFGYRNLVGDGLCRGLSFQFGKGRLRISVPNFDLSKPVARRQFDQRQSAAISEVEDTNTGRIEIPRENKKRTCA